MKNYYLSVDDGFFSFSSLRTNDSKPQCLASMYFNLRNNGFLLSSSVVFTSSLLHRATLNGKTSQQIQLRFDYFLLVLYRV